jgi:PmbA protein
MSGDGARAVSLEELGELAQRAMRAAGAAGAGDAEAYAEDSRGLELRVYQDRVESLTESAARGVGIRAWLHGRTGYAYGTDLSEDGLSRLAEAAVGAARVADEDPHAAPPLPGGVADPIDGLADPATDEWATERKVELARAIERSSREADERVKVIEETIYADESERVAIASSRGAEGAFEATTAYAYLQAIAEGEGDPPDRQSGLGFGLGRAPSDLDPDAIGRESAERATALLGAEKPASRSCPVVLDPTVAASFAGFVGGVLCADEVQRGRSPFAGRLGDEIGSGALSLLDEGRDPEGLASSPFDAEGVPRGRTPLIESGTLANYLHDSYTAGREGGDARSTGNASRAGYRSAPSVGTSNLIVAEGDASFDELIAEAGDGVYVTDVAGLHSGVNPVSGTFSVGATGILIENGALAKPAKEFTIASDLVSMLKAVTATGSEARWVPFGGSVRTPPLLIGEMAVGGI